MLINQIYQSIAAYSPAAGPATYTGIIATRGTSPSNKFGATAANVRSAHFARGNITQLSILCPNYYGSESAPGATMSIKAAVEYPAGVCTQILFSASATGTVPDGGMLLSDALTIAIPNGERFWIRMFMQCSAGLVGTFNFYSDINPPTYSFMGDAVDNSGGVTDQTMTGVTIANVESSACYHPIIIGPTTLPSVAIFGDSMAAGMTDMAGTTVGPAFVDTAGDWGEIARTIGPKFGYFNAGFTGETAGNFISNHTRRVSVLTYCTHVIVEYGVNDLFADSATAATVESRLTTIYGYCTGKTVFQTTYPPRTNSTDSWVTTGNQSTITSPAAYETNRVLVNTHLRGATFGPAGGAFDVGNVVETSLNSGIWKVNGTSSKTVDGVHPSRYGYIDMQTSGAINTALIGAGAAAPTDTGSGWGATGTLITLSATRRTNDTAKFVNNGTNHCIVRGASGLTSGLKYFEIEIPGNMSFSVGLMDGTTAAGSGLNGGLVGEVNNSAGFFPDGSALAFTSIFTGTGSASTFGTVIGGVVYRMAVDFTNGFAYLARDNVWLLSGVPTSGSSGTGHCIAWTPGGVTIYPAFSFLNSVTGDNKPVRLRTNSFLYPLTGSLAGYSAWG